MIFSKILDTAGRMLIGRQLVTGVALPFFNIGVIDAHFNIGVIDAHFEELGKLAASSDKLKPFASKG